MIALKIYLPTVILALFFILSGFGKLLDVASFRNLLQVYGFTEGMTLIAVPLPPLEIILGMALLYLGNRKNLIVISLISLVGFTGAFGYAYFFEGVEDCGCFGGLSALQTSPWLSFTRNFILLALCGYLYKTAGETAALSMTRTKWRMLVILGSVAFMASGISSVKPLFVPQNPSLNAQVAETELGQVVAVSSDSTYLFFAYSVSCSHCWDAIENVKTYKETGLVDEIIGLTDGLEIDLMDFEDRFQPNFSTKIIDGELFAKLAPNTPAAYFVQNGVVKNVQNTHIYSAASFMEYVMQEF